LTAFRAILAVVGVAVVGLVIFLAVRKTKRYEV
jgi:hypothetical protein